LDLRDAMVLALEAVRDRACMWCSLRKGEVHKDSTLSPWRHRIDESFDPTCGAGFVRDVIADLKEPDART